MNTSTAASPGRCVLYQNNIHFMTKSYRLTFILGLTMTIGLYGCPALNYKIFVRNTTSDTARLTLIYKPPFDTISKSNISVRAANEILPVRKKNILLLKEDLITSADSGKITLTLPPKSTVYLSDIINSFYLFSDKTLVVEHAGKSDTMTAWYPYKNLQGFKRKLDPSYNYFYRTIIYYDIK